MSFNDKITYEVELTTANMLKGADVTNNTVNTMINNFGRADVATKNLSKSQAQLQTQATQTAKAVNGQLNQALTNTSYQIQDIAVQLAGGQNPFLVMAQQIPQLLVGFGALAAGIGAAVAVLGGLYLAFGDSASNAEKLEKAIEQVKAVMTVGADGVANYSDELKELNGLSESLVKLKLGLAVADQNKAINLSLTGLKEALDDTRGSFDTYTDQVTKVTGVKAGTDAFKEAELAFRGYSSAISKFNADGDVDQLESSLTNLASSGANNTEKGRELIRTTIDMIAKFRQGQLTIDALKESMGGLEEETTGAQNGFTNLIQSLILQREELVSGERAALKARLQMDGLSDSEIKSALAIYDNNEAIRQQKEEAEKTGKAMQDLGKDLDAFFAKESGDSTKQDQQKTATLTRQVQTIGLTPLEEIQNRYDQEYDILRAAQERDIISKEEFAAREIQINKNKADAINRYNQQQMQNQQFFSNTQGQLLGALANTLSAFGSSMDKNNKKSFEKQKKFAIATALINTALAVSQALGAAPPPINFALAALSGAAGAVQIAAIKNQEFSGNREFGGPVSAGSMYRVGEKGNPEFFKNKSGQLSMIPGENGEVIPADKLMGSGVNWSINVENYGPDKAYATIDDINRTVNVRIGREVAGMRDGTSQFGKAMKASGNYKSRASS